MLENTVLKWFISFQYWIQILFFGRDFWDSGGIFYSLGIENAFFHHCKYKISNLSGWDILLLWWEYPPPPRNSTLIWQHFVWFNVQFEKSMSIADEAWIKDLEMTWKLHLIKLFWKRSMCVGLKWVLASGVEKNHSFVSWIHES